MPEKSMAHAKPIDIARVALHKMAERGIAPTPENYVREYRVAAGLPDAEANAVPFPPADPRTVELVRAIVELVTEVTAGLSVGVERFDVDSQLALARIDQIQDADEMALLLRTVMASALSLKQVVDASNRQLVETRQRLEAVSSELQRTQELARTDPLTGFGNRRAMEELVRREIARSRRTAEPFSLAIFDIDHFKRVNDQFGHDVGDQALIHVANVVKASIREADEICRYGGEEFVVTLPGAGAQGAHFVMDRMRTRLENTPLITGEHRITLRFSAGVAQLSSGESFEILLHRVDAALYEAKNTGRNRVVAAGDKLAARGAAPPA